MLSLSIMSDPLQLHGLWPNRLLCSWDFPGKNTGVDSHFLLQGIFPSQGWNPGLLDCRQIYYYLKHWGSHNLTFTFISIPKKGNARECSNYHTIALISHVSKVKLKILQASARPQNSIFLAYWLWRMQWQCHSLMSLPYFNSRWYSFIY